MTRTDSPPSRHGGAACLALVLFVVCGSIARSVDVVRAGYGVKQDEATYVSMALSLAFDRDLTYQRRDLERLTPGELPSDVPGQAVNCRARKEVSHRHVDLEDVAKPGYDAGGE